MAKKQSIPLTPEELAAKNARKAEKRKIFGDTFFKAVAVLLAIVFVYSVVYVAFGSGMTVIQKVTATGAAASGSGASSSGSGGASSSDPAGTADPGTAGSGDAAQSGSGAQAGTNDAAAVAEKINAATKAAVDAKAGYDWERHCTVNDIDVGSQTATDTLNKVIQGVDPNADLNSVVGGFLGRGDKKETVKKGETLDTMKITKDDGTTENLYHGASYTLKATQLKAEDIKNLKINGDTYTFEIPDTTNPGRDNNTPLSRFTNDIVVQSEVDQEIKDRVSVVSVNSLEAKYTGIKVTVTIKDGKLVDLSYSYRGDAVIALKALIVNITGTGNIITNAKYTNFKY